MSYLHLWCHSPRLCYPWSLLKSLPHIPDFWCFCFKHICHPCHIWPTLDIRTASTIATSTVHSKLDYHNSLFLYIESTQFKCLQLIPSSLDRAVARMSEHNHITQTTPLAKLQSESTSNWHSAPYNPNNARTPNIFTNTLLSSQPTLPDHPVSDCLDPQSLCISSYPTEPYPKLCHVIGESATWFPHFFGSFAIVANHPWWPTIIWL